LSIVDSFQIDRLTKHTLRGDRWRRGALFAMRTFNTTLAQRSAKFRYHCAFRPAAAPRTALHGLSSFERVMSEVTEYQSWVCLICGWVYNEAEGLPDEGIAPGTRFADIPADWRCPLCDVGKEDFVVVDF
jgi:rubredoxin